MLVDLSVDTILQKPDRYSLASRKTETRSFKLTFIRRPYDLDHGTLIKVSSSCVWKENKLCPNRIKQLPLIALHRCRSGIKDKLYVHELCRFTEFDSAKEIKF